MSNQTITHVGVGEYNPQLKNIPILSDTVRKAGPNRYTKLYPNAIKTYDVLNYQDLKDKVYVFVSSLQCNGEMYEYTNSPENDSFHLKLTETIKVSQAQQAPHFHKTLPIDETLLVNPPSEFTVIVFNQNNVTSYSSPILFVMFD